MFVNYENREQMLKFNKTIEVGDVITVKYSGVNSNGTINFPTFLNHRWDMSWEDLVVQQNQNV